MNIAMFVYDRQRIAYRESCGPDKQWFLCKNRTTAVLPSTLLTRRLTDYVKSLKLRGGGWKKRQRLHLSQLVFLHHAHGRGMSGDTGEGCPEAVVEHLAYQCPHAHLAHQIEARLHAIQPTSCTDVHHAIMLALSSIMRKIVYP